VTADDDGQSSGAAVAEKPNVESLDIQDAELRAMTELAPLLGRSPRALKRFINVYRLVKATLLPVEYSTFIGPEGGSYSERPVPPRRRQRGAGRSADGVPGAVALPG